jgi:Glucose/sorbosone dehydrogenases
MRRLPLFAATGALVLGLSLGLAGCAPASPAPTPTPARPTPTPTPTVGAVQPAGAPETVVDGLGLPWSMARLDGETLISQRDDARILSLGDDGALREVGTVPGVRHGGEGGLLGLAALDARDGIWVYAFHTGADDNRIVRMPYAGGALGEPEVVLAGIARAGNHNGGRIAFGPDGMLYATTGDAAQPGLAQDPASLNGKILRLTPTGGVPDDNPIPDSPVYSLGHRNPQGIAWDAAGQLWAAEFGQNTWDEFNRIDPGANYGWPVVEGQGGVEGYVDPVLQWSTAEASPSGLAYVDGTFFLAALRGERLWAIQVDASGAASATPWFVGEFGRIRDVAAGPDGGLWFVTSNTGGRGTPRDGDDRLLRVDLLPVEG